MIRFNSIATLWLLGFGLLSCSTSTPKHQAFPALDQQIQEQVRRGQRVIYPALQHSTKPQYPSLPAAGSVWAVMRVNEKGGVSEVKIVGQAPELYQDSIRAALLQWRFSPGSIDGQPTEFPMQVKVTFEGQRGQAQSEKATSKPSEEGIQFKNEQWIVQSIFPELHRQLSIFRGQGKKMMGPKVIKAWKPKHPNPLAEGSVYVAFIVNEAAQPEQLHIVGDAPKLFQEVIADALKKWKFQPGTVDGKPHPYPVAGKWTFDTQNIFMVKP